MATYKVLQDVEAEDKFLGPLTLKQFIFGAIAVVSAYLSFLLITKGIWVMAIPMLPIIFVTGFLAFPWGRDQPTETWLLAKLRYYFKPRKRVWDQTGLQELVKITAPPPKEEFTGDNLSQTEVKSRLRALADTIDSRGWAVKNVDRQPVASDRLVDGSGILPQTAVGQSDTILEDMFETHNNPQLDAQLAKSSEQYRNTVQQTIAGATQPQAQAPQQQDNLWFAGGTSPQPNGLATFTPQIATSAPARPQSLPDMFRKPDAGITDEEASILRDFRAKKALDHEHFRNHRSIPNPGQANDSTPAPPVTAAPNPATIELARNNDRTVASIQREASDGEVIVPLH